MRIFILHETKHASEDVDLRESHTFLEVCVFFKQRIIDMSFLTDFCVQHVFLLDN